MPTASGWVFLLVICVITPYLAIRTGLRTRRPGGTPSRALYFASFALSQAMPLVVASFAASYEGIELFPGPTINGAALAAAACFLLLGLGTLPARWRLKPLDERRRTLWMLPQRMVDLWWWALVALIAGICEEIVYRGVLFTIIDRMLERWWLAACICAAVFSLCHFVQGWRAMIAIFLLALGFHCIVRLSGDLYTAMAVHIVYDLLAGLILLRLARANGLLPATGGA